jgi:osmotically-inducible protein OsmY
MRHLLAAVAALVPVLHGCAPSPIVAAMGVPAASDRRTTGMFVEDENISLTAEALINSKYPDNSHINVTSFNRNVLLTGEAATDAVKADIESIVRGVENVRHVTNEITIAAISPLDTRGNDALITSTVKGNFAAEGSFQVNHVKVVTQRGVVYLMGLVTPEEGEAAAHIASTTSRVTRVVKVFEYIHPSAPAKVQRPTAAATSPSANTG